MKLAMSVLLSLLGTFCTASLLAACSSEPTFSRNRTVVCHMKRGDDLMQVTIVFSNEGRHALIDWDGRNERVEFDGSFLLTDYYSGGDMTLRIDPEVYVADRARAMGGLCQ